MEALAQRRLNFHLTEAEMIYFFLGMLTAACILALAIAAWLCWVFWGWDGDVPDELFTERYSNYRHKWGQERWTRDY